MEALKHKRSIAISFRDSWGWGHDGSINVIHLIFCPRNFDQEINIVKFSFELSVVLLLCVYNVK